MLSRWKTCLRLNVINCIGANNQDVIKIYKYERESLQEAVHELLEGLAHVMQAEQHPEPEQGGDGGLLDIWWVYGYLMITSHEVYLGVYQGSSQLCYEI